MTERDVIARILGSEQGYDIDSPEEGDDDAIQSMYERADRILQALEGEGWGKKLEPRQLSSTETIRLIIQSWINQSTKECRESGFEPNGDTHIMRFSPHYVSHSQMEHWIRVISGIEEQRDTLRRQLDALTGEKLLTLVFNNIPPKPGKNVYLTVANRMKIARAIAAAIAAAKGE